MGKVIILPYTTKEPITMIGYCAGICWGADTSDKEKNFKRGLSCINSEHGRTWEYPEVYSVIEGYSAKFGREFYTHIGGAPSRLQASTRYIDYGDFPYVIPKNLTQEQEEKFKQTTCQISGAIKDLIHMGVPKEDANNLLPLAMETKIMDKRNLRNIIDMSHQRLCSRAYWEYRQFMQDYIKALSEYSYEWGLLMQLCKPKCEVCGFCPEARGCGRMPKREIKNIVVEK